MKLNSEQEKVLLRAVYLYKSAFSDWEHRNSYEFEVADKLYKHLSRLNCHGYIEIKNCKDIPEGYYE